MKLPAAPDTDRKMDTVFRCREQAVILRVDIQEKNRAQRLDRRGLKLLCLRSDPPEETSRDR